MGTRQFRVMVVGGYGLFGGRLVQRLSLQAGLHVIVAGRAAAPAAALCDKLRPQTRATLATAVVDALRPALFAQALAEHAPDAVVHTAGPFQGQDYRVAEACIAQRVHCIDLADGRAFVAGIGTLDAAARAAGVLVASGASSVPALSCAAADRLAQGLVRVSQVDIGISPGNRTARGLSTVQAVLAGCGKALPGAATGHGVAWHGRWRHTYPAPVGARWLSPCDAPDLALLPQRYPGQPVVSFGAGLELAVLHRGLNLLARLTQAGLVHDWAAYARPLKAVAYLLRHHGSDAGAMHVTVRGTLGNGQAMQRTWTLLATHGDGPFVPTLAAAALLQRLAHGPVPAAGARACMGMLGLDEFTQAAQGLHIGTLISDPGAP